jgi:hypothetical protein
MTDCGVGTSVAADDVTPAFEDEWDSITDWSVGPDVVRREAIRLSLPSRRKGP